MHKVEWTGGALRDLQKIDPVIAKRILRKITWLGEHMASLMPEALSGELAGMYKLRAGDWRVVYRMEGETIVIEAVGHRRDIYNL